MTLGRALLPFALAALAPSSVLALVITFEAVPDGELPSYTEQGVTFTAPGGPNLTADQLGNTPNGTKGIIDSSPPYVPLRADISGGASYVAVDIGDFNSDDDDLFLRVYGPGDVFLGQAVTTIPSSFTGMVTLSVSMPNISYVIFGGSGLGGESNVYSDNFTWEPTAAVPEPGTLALLGVGLVGLVALRRRAA